MHPRLGYVFDRHRNVPLPQQHFLVVGGGGEAGVIVVKGDGVDRGQVVIVFLNHLPRGPVVRVQTIVRSGKNEEVVVGRVEFSGVRNLTVGDGGDALSSLGIPQAQETIETPTQEATAIRDKIDATDCSCVA